MSSTNLTKFVNGKNELKESYKQEMNDSKLILLFIYKDANNTLPSNHTFFYV